MDTARGNFRRGDRMTMSEADRAQAALDVGQLPFDIDTGDLRRRGVFILEHQQPLLPNIGETEVENGVQDEVVSTVLQREADQDLI